VIYNLFKKCYIPPSDRSADGEINLASFYSSGVRCSALGRLDLVHLHALDGVHNVPPPPPPPPPPHSLGSQNTPLQVYISLLFSIISVKTPSAFWTVFYTHQNVKEF